MSGVIKYGCFLEIQIQSQGITFRMLENIEFTSNCLWWNSHHSALSFLNSNVFFKTHFNWLIKATILPWLLCFSALQVNQSRNVGPSWLFHTGGDFGLIFLFWSAFPEEHLLSSDNSSTFLWLPVQKYICWKISPLFLKDKFVKYCI